MKWNNSFISKVLTTITSIIIFSSIIYSQGVLDKKPTNLKVLPDTTSSQQVRQMMQMFTSALDVHCSYCHEDPKGGNFGSVDFASDAKDTKKVARVMMKMVQEINNNFIAEASQIDKLNGPVSCVTCHHGMAHIETLSEVLFKTYNRKGIDSTFSKYDQLKNKYYGGFTFNFKSESLNELGSNIMETKNYDDAIKILDFNAKMYPNSGETFSELGEAYLAKGDKAQARENFEKTLKLNPWNRRIQATLKKLE